MAKKTMLGMRDSTGRIERQNLEEKYKRVIQANPALNRKLVSFQANKNIPFYGWFSFKEGFSSQMVKMFIKEYPRKSGRVLDPFLGSGTTSFSAREVGFNSLGIDTLPISEFILKTRLAAENVGLDSLIRVVGGLKRIDFMKQKAEDKYFKHIRITEKAFPKDTEHKIKAFLSYVDGEIGDENIKQLLKFACFSILEKISYTRKDGQCLRWDYRSKKGRSKFNKGKILSFEDALFDKLTQILSDIKNQGLFPKDLNTGVKTEVKTGSSLEILPLLEEQSFDLIISSPPYCNRYDYTRTYALELAFLGVDEDRIRALRQDLLSCTVENKDKIEFLKGIYTEGGQLDLFNRAEEAFTSNKALQEVLSILDNYRKEGKLNNPGIYRMVKNYFYEHAFIIFEMARLLKKGGQVYYVNDNVKYAGEVIPVDLILSEFAEKAGLKVKCIYKLQNGKGNSSQQMGIHGREELRKCVYYWEK